ncbi:AMP-binding protein [Rhodococcus hoagii]|nr:AMP-binding protein [Prescottella equi]
MLPNVLIRHAGSGGVAVRAAGVEITYAELDARSSALARRLISLGCGPEDAVAVLLPRSIDSVVALWAIAKTGAAYVPVDPELPPLRLAQHLDVVGFAIGRGVELPGSVVCSWTRTHRASRPRRSPMASGCDRSVRRTPHGSCTRPGRRDSPRPWWCHTAVSRVCSRRSEPRMRRLPTHACCTSRRCRSTPRSRRS